MLVELDFTKNIYFNPFYLEYAPVCSALYSPIVVFICCDFLFYAAHMIFHVITTKHGLASCNGGCCDFPFYAAHMIYHVITARHG